MTEPKIRTIVYDHKVIDWVKFGSRDGDPTYEEVFDMCRKLGLKIIDSLEAGGIFKIKIDRPLSKADKQHRLKVIEKNLADQKARYGRYSNYEYQTYLRLKEKYGE